MKRIGCIVAGVALTLGSLNIAFADSTKIGVVDLQKIMQTSPQMKSIQEKLEKQFKPRRDELVSMEASLKKEMDKFKKDSAVMSQTQRKELEKKIVGEQQQFEKQGQQYQQELSAAHNEAMESFYNKIRASIAKIAKSKNYDIVLQKDAAPFSAEKLDITEQVMKTISE